MHVECMRMQIRPVFIVPAPDFCSGVALTRTHSGAPAPAPAHARARAHLERAQSSEICHHGEDR